MPALENISYNLIGDFYHAIFTINYKAGEVNVKI